jgi:hypothetical protein
MKKCARCEASILDQVLYCPKCGAKQLGPVSEEELKKDPYDILQVSHDAEVEVIEAAYRSLARKYHPDVASVSSQTERMQELNWAHAILADQDKRSDWDRQHFHTTSHSKPFAAAGHQPSSSFASDPPPPVTTDLPRPKLPTFYWILMGAIVLLFGAALISRGDQSTALPPASSPTRKPAATVRPSSQPTRRPTSASATRRPATETPPQSTPSNTSNPIEKLGCTKWDEVDKSFVGDEICVYGVVVSVKEDSNPYTIQFSSDWNDFKAQDWNYYYSGIEPGMCIVVSGEVADNVSFLVLLISKNDGAIQVSSQPRDCR